MRVLVAMSGGVDSSVAASLLVDAGHDVTGATLKLWGGASDSGCCSLGDVTDARRVADRLGIAHHVFNFTELFSEKVVDPYATAHARGETPNPCVECNRHLKFDALLSRARRLGFDAIATGHHARIDRLGSVAPRLRRGVDEKKDQSYVLSVLTTDELRDVLLPIGELEKSTVRSIASSRGLVTAEKPDSQDVCFIQRHGPPDGRRAFLESRIELHAADVVDEAGAVLGSVQAVELFTVGQRRGLPPAGGAPPRYVVDVDVRARTVHTAVRSGLFVSEVGLKERTWVDGPLPVGSPVTVQTSAHGGPIDAFVSESGVVFAAPSRRVAPGQLVALYEHDVVVGSGVARR